MEEDQGKGEEGIVIYGMCETKVKCENEGKK